MYINLFLEELNFKSFLLNHKKTMENSRGYARVKFNERTFFLIYEGKFYLLEKLN